MHSVDAGSPRVGYASARRRIRQACRGASVRSSVERDRPRPTARTRDPHSLLVSALALFNESDDLDATLRKTLTMVTTALRRAHRGDLAARRHARDVELRYSSSDGTPDVVAFEAEGKALGVGLGPALVSRVVKTGRGSASASIGAEGRGSRAVMAAAADIHSALTFPIRGKGNLVGVLAVFREPTAPPPRAALEPMPAICHHLGRFIERVQRRSRDPRSRHGACRARFHGCAHRAEEPARVRPGAAHHSATAIRRAFA